MNVSQVAGVNAYFDPTDGIDATQEEAQGSRVKRAVGGSGKKPKTPPKINPRVGDGHGDPSRAPAHRHEDVGSFDGKPRFVVKPQPKKDQKVDSEGWPLNRLNQRVDLNGNAIDRNGRRINDRNQLINERGHAINEKQQLINTKDQPIDTQGRRIDSQNRLINNDGRLVNEQKQLIDLDNKRVNREGYLIDQYGRPLDKDGKVARSQQSAVLGNNEPHAQIAGMNTSLNKAPGVGASQVTPPPPPKPSAEKSAQSAAKTDEVVKKRWLPATSELAATAIRGAVLESAGALASLPIKLAEAAAVSAVSETIKQKYLPTPLTTPPVAPTGGSSGTPMTEAQKAEKAEEDKKQLALDSAIDNVQVSAFETRNALLKLEHGTIPEELVPGEKWPTDALGRLDSLENLVDDIEASTHRLQDVYKVYFKSYLPETDAALGAEGIAARTEALERRLDAVSKARKKIEAEIEEPSKDD